MSGEQKNPSLKDQEDVTISPQVAHFLELLEKETHSGRKVPSIVEVQEIDLTNGTAGAVSQDNIDDQGNKNDSKTLTKVLGGLTSFAEKLAEMQQKNPNYFKNNGTSDSVSGTTAMFGTGNEKNHSNVKLPVAEMKVSALPIQPSTLTMSENNRNMTKFSSTRDILAVLVKILPDLLLKRLISISNKKGKYVHEVGGKLENNPNIKVAENLEAGQQLPGQTKSLNDHLGQGNTKAQQSVRPGTSPLKSLLNHFSNMQSNLAAAQQKLKANQTSDSILLDQIGGPVTLDGEIVENDSKNELPIEVSAVVSIIAGGENGTGHKETGKMNAAPTAIVEVEQIRDADDNVDKSNQRNVKNLKAESSNSDNNLERDDEKQTQANENNLVEKSSEILIDNERWEPEGSGESAEGSASEKEARTDDQVSQASKVAEAGSKSSKERTDAEREDITSERRGTTTTTTTTTIAPTTTTTTEATTTTTTITPRNKRNESQPESDGQAKSELSSSSQNEHLKQKSDKSHAERDVPEEQFGVKNGSQPILVNLTNDVEKNEHNTDNASDQIIAVIDPGISQSGESEGGSHFEPGYILEIDQYGNPIRNGGGRFLSNAFDKFTSLTKSAAKELKSVPNKVKTTVTISKKNRNRNGRTNRRANRQRSEQVNESNDKSSLNERSRNEDSGHKNQRSDHINQGNRRSKDKSDLIKRSYSHFGHESLKERSNVNDINDDIFERGPISSKPLLDSTDYPDNRRVVVIDDFDNESERDEPNEERNEIDDNERNEVAENKNYRNHERGAGEGYDRYNDNQDSSERENDGNDNVDEIDGENDDDDDDDDNDSDDNNDDIEDRNDEVDSRNDFDDSSENERFDSPHTKHRQLQKFFRAPGERENEVGFDQPFNNEKSKRRQKWRTQKMDQSRRKNHSRRLRNERGKDQRGWDKMDHNLQETNYADALDENKPEDRGIESNWDIKQNLARR